VRFGVSLLPAAAPHHDPALHRHLGDLPGADDGRVRPRRPRFAGFPRLIFSRAE